MEYNSLPQISGPGGPAQYEHEINISRLELQAANRRITIKLLMVIAALALVALAWMFRWQAVEIHPSGESPAPAFLVNRWTGEILYLQGINWVRVEELKR